MSLISVQAVGRWFGDRELLKDVSFRIAQGDRIGLVGPNGSASRACCSTILTCCSSTSRPTTSTSPRSSGWRPSW